MSPSQDVLLTGAGGQLGRALVERLRGSNRTIHTATRSELDMADPAAVQRAIASMRPSWVVNCAAWTRVDDAESRREDAFGVNDEALGTLADAAHAVGARIVHFGTDYVFDGEFGDGETPEAYCEDAAANPINCYGASKLAGERRLLSHPVRAVVLRTSWLYAPFGSNFFMTMLRHGEKALAEGTPLSIVADQIGTPTDVFSLARQTERVLQLDLEGLFHASCHGRASWFDFAQAIFESLGWDVALTPVSTRECPVPLAAARPPFSVLRNRRLEELGEDLMGAWEDGLGEVVRRYRDRAARSGRGTGDG